MSTVPHSTVTGTVATLPVTYLLYRQLEHGYIIGLIGNEWSGTMIENRIHFLQVSGSVIFFVLPPPFPTTPHLWEILLLVLVTQNTLGPFSPPH